MKRGASLLELVLALVVFGLVLGIALPPLERATDTLAVNAAAGQIVAAHRRARITAIIQSRIIELTIDSNDLAIRPRGAPADLWHAAGPASSRVTMAGAPRVLTFSPVGLSLGVSNASFRLSRGTATRTVVVSRLGRVRLAP
jgi:Tfp pilus assembly protein FimT